MNKYPGAIKHTKKQNGKIRHFLPKSRAASLAVIILTPLTALAVGIVAMVAIANRKHEPIRAEAISATTTISEKDLAAAIVPVIFENTSLEEIMKVISAHYSVTVQFQATDTTDIHLSYKFDARLPLDEIVEQLNTFDQIDIRIDGNTLIVD